MTPAPARSATLEIVVLVSEKDTRSAAEFGFALDALMICLPGSHAITLVVTTPGPLVPGFIRTLNERPRIQWRHVALDTLLAGWPASVHASPLAWLPLAYAAFCQTDFYCVITSRVMRTSRIDWPRWQTLARAPTPWKEFPAAADDAAARLLGQAAPTPLTIAGLAPFFSPALMRNTLEMVSRVGGEPAEARLSGIDDDDMVDLTKRLYTVANQATLESVHDLLLAGKGHPDWIALPNLDAASPDYDDRLYATLGQIIQRR